MTIVRPFRAVRYDPGRVDLDRVIVPPYDVVAADERADFYDRDPHNAIRFELTREVSEEATTDYSEVATLLAQWLESGVLRRDEEPGMYALRQRFTAPDGRTLERDGFFAELELEDYSRRVVRPHERTLAGPKADRLRLMRATRANLSSVFLLYEDRSEELAGLLAAAVEGDGAIRAKDDSGVAYALAPLSGSSGSPVIQAIRGFLETRPVVIADGHHRYETALAYRDEVGAGNADGSPFGSILAYFANAYAPGNLLLPIHRVVRKATVPTDLAWRERLGGWLERSVSLSGPDEIAAVLARELAPHAGHPAFGADDASGVLRVFWREKPLEGELMVRILEREVLGGVFELAPEAIRDGAVSFPKSAERAASSVRSGDGSVALYLNPLSPDDVFRATAAGDVMPQKSTFFYPKIPTGLVFRVAADSA